MRTSELSGAALDYAVAMCEQQRDDKDLCSPVEWHMAGYSSVWEFGGPIIEREKIELVPTIDIWDAYTQDAHVPGSGDTPLVAAMRCYVDSKLGDEVNVPEEIR